MSIVCPVCERAIQEAAPKICPLCGALIAVPTAPETRILGDTESTDENIIRLGTSHFGRTMLRLRVEGAEKSFIVDPDQMEALIIGRRDPAVGDPPDIDLEDYDAFDRGVSRKHARILRRGNHLMIVDSGTRNGSYLNGQRLIAEQPRILRDGDELRLGKLVLAVEFIQTENDQGVTS